ncbi:MAG: sugar phosphate isomerase/epimerase [Opitutus sp.]
MNSAAIPPQSAACISRRSFVTSLAVALAGASLTRASSASPVPDTKRKVIVGAHAWVYAATQPNYDYTPVLPQIFSDLSYAGVDGLELMHVALKPDDAVERIGNLSRQYSLPILGTSFNGAMFDRAQHSLVLENAELVITRLAQLGGRTLGTSVGQLRGADAKKLKTPEQLDAQVDCLRQITKICEANKVVLNLHNHTYEVENNLHDLKGTLARMPEVKLGPDLNWLIRGGVDPATFIRTYGRQIVFLHLRDQYKDGRWSEAFGEGDTDFKAIAAALHEVNFEGNANIELAHEKDFKPTRPLRDSFKQSRVFVRDTLGY